jgi:hypothetical protein
MKIGELLIIALLAVCARTEETNVNEANHIDPTESGLVLRVLTLLICMFLVRFIVRTIPRVINVRATANKHISFIKKKSSAFKNTWEGLDPYGIDKDEVVRLEKQISALVKIIRNIEWIRDRVVFFKDVQFVENPEDYVKKTNQFIDDNDIIFVFNLSGCGLNWVFTPEDKRKIRRILKAARKKFKCKNNKFLVVYDHDTPSWNDNNATIGDAALFMQNEGCHVMSNLANFAAETEKYTIHWVYRFWFVDTIRIFQSKFGTDGIPMYVGGQVTDAKALKLSVPMLYIALGGGGGVVKEIRFLAEMEKLRLYVTNVYKQDNNGVRTQTSVTQSELLKPCGNSCGACIALCGKSHCFVCDSLC